MTSQLAGESWTRSTRAPINLQLGWPSPRLLPESDIEKATRDILTRDSDLPNGLEYGAGAGSDRHRQIVASWLTQFYNPQGFPIPPARISFTSGASSNLASILQIYTDPTYTQNCWLVEPTYFLACRIFEDNGFAGKIRAIAEDDEGICLEAFEKLLETSNEIKSIHKATEKFCREVSLYLNLVCST